MRSFADNTGRNWTNFFAKLSSIGNVILDREGNPYGTILLAGAEAAEADGTDGQLHDGIAGTSRLELCWLLEFNYSHPTKTA